MSLNIKNPKSMQGPREKPDAVRHHGVVLHAGFDDLDHFAETAMAWDLDFRRIDATPFRGWITQVDLGDIRYDSARFTAPLEQHGSPPPGRWTLAIPAQIDPRMVWRGRDLRPSCLPVYHPGSEINVISRPGFFVLPIALAPETFEHHARELGLPDLERLLARHDVVTVAPHRLGRLSRVLQCILSALTIDADLLAQPVVRQTLTERIPRLLLRSIAQATPSKPVPRPTQTIDECLTIIQSSHEPLTVAQLAALIGVSDRAVQYAFAKHFAVTPKAYLKARQLNLARACLRAAPSDTLISDIANACGFWHMGQFAADYRRMFRERPSDTRSHDNPSVDAPRRRP